MTKGVMQGRAIQVASGLALVASMIAGPAYAQSAPRDQADRGADTADADIVVTAQKREQRLQDVPISISAISSDAMERQRIESVSDLFGRVPSLFFTSESAEVPISGRSASPSIRGMVRRGLYAGEPVGVYVDDIYQPGLGFDTDFLDLERIEVLRGPQGTLFGRNTPAGAIRLITRRPTSEFTGSASIEAREFDSYKGRLSLSGPIASGLAANLSLQGEGSDGYIRNSFLNTGADRRRSGSARLGLYYTPSGSFNALLTGDYTSGAFGAIFGVPEGCRCYETSTDIDGRLKARNYGFGLTMNQDMGGVRLTSATGYRNVRENQRSDSDGTSVLVGNEQSYVNRSYFLSQELRLASQDGGDLQWVVGGFAFKNRYTQDRNWQVRDTTSSPTAADYAVFEGTSLLQFRSIDRNGVAAFGQATYTVAGRLDLTAGARWSREAVRNGFDYDITIPLISPTPLIFFQLETPYLRRSAFTPMGSVTMRWTPQFMTYVTISRGFDAGGWNNTGTTATPFNAQTTTNYEVGSKGSLFDRRLSYALSLYQIDMNDLAVDTTRVINGIPQSVFDNAASARSRGFELEMSVRPVSGFMFSGSLSYTDAKFRTYIDGVGVDRSGERFTQVPRWLGSFQAEYRVGLTDGVDMLLAGNFRHVSAVSLGTGGSGSGDPFRRRPAYDVADASISFEFDDWRVALLANNIFDNYAADFTSYAAFNNQGFEHVIAPRNVGFRITRTW